MTKNKRPAPKKSVAAPEEQEEALTQNLYELAIDIAEQDDGEAMDEPLKKQSDDFNRLVRKCLQQKKDSVLYEALERAKYDAEDDAYRFLRSRIEEAAEIFLSRRDEGPTVEVNAFVIPLFAHTNGGLHREQCFQDEEAFDQLTRSLQEAQLESKDASVVLVSHAYHLDEIDAIHYSRLHEMVREALTTMTSKKAIATPAIEQSMRGWPDNHFEPEDLAVELRFLLGFALKKMDDPFYQLPQDEEGIDRYFETRAERFQQWTQQAAPLVKRCLVTDGSNIDIHFLYQDLFHGGKEAGIAEYHMLRMMTELHQGLELHDTVPENTKAIIGPTDVEGEMVLRVNLYADEDGTLLASSEKPIDIMRDLRVEADDVYDALMTIGVQSLSLALKFDEDGQAIDVRPYGH